MFVKFGELIYTPEVEDELTISKRETHTPKIEAPNSVRAGEPFTISQHDPALFQVV